MQIQQHKSKSTCKVRNCIYYTNQTGRHNNNNHYFAVASRQCGQSELRPTEHLAPVTVSIGYEVTLWQTGDCCLNSQTKHLFKPRRTTGIRPWMHFCRNSSDASWVCARSQWEATPTHRQGKKLYKKKIITVEQRSNDSKQRPHLPLKAALIFAVFAVCRCTSAFSASLTSGLRDRACLHLQGAPRTPVNSFALASKSSR